MGSERMPLNPRNFGLGAGILWSLCILVPTLIFVNPAAAEEQIKFSGYVIDADGNPYPDVVVIISGPLFVDRVRVETRTDSQGYYEIYIDKEKSYSILIGPANKKQAQNYTYMYEMPAYRHVERANRIEIREDFTLQYAGNIVLRGYSNGSLVRVGHFKAIPQVSVREILYATDLRGIPMEHSSEYPVFDDYAIAHGWDFEEAIPSIVVRPNTPTVINVLWEVPGFGQVMLKADNGGPGYATDDLLEINLNYELAKTKYRTLKERFDNSMTAGYNFSDEVAGMLAEAKSFLDQADLANDEAQRASFSDFSLNKTLWAGERLELELADQNIEKYRKVEVRIRLLDNTGNPIAATVSYNQTDHDFVFAIAREGDYEEQTASILKDAGFNAVWLPFYKVGKIGHGQYDWDTFDYNVDKYYEAGYQVLGEGLIALEAGWEAHPAWWDDLDSFDELNSTIYEHTRAVADRYGDRVGLWIVSHEPHVKPTYAVSYKFYFSLDNAIEIIKTAIRGVKDANQSLHTAVMVGYGVDGSFIGQPEGDEITRVPYEFYEVLNARGVDYNYLELQIDYGSYLPRPDGTRNPIHLTRDFASMAELLDWYSALDKPVRIQIFKAPSEHFPEAYGYWHRHRDPQLQAERVVGFYKIAFSRPFVEEITYWPVNDAFGGKVGLLDEAGNPKPAYYALKELITQKWTTKGQATTDADGSISFRGFAGTYTISVPSYEPHEIHVTEAGPNDFILQLKTTYNLPPNSPTLTAPANDTWTDNNTPTFSWIFSDAYSIGQASFRWQADNNTNFDSIDYDSGEIASMETTYTPPFSIGDGIWYWRVRTKDTGGDWGPWSDYWIVKIDTTLPFGSIIINNGMEYTNSTLVTLNLTYSDVTSSVCQVRYSNDGGWDTESWESPADTKSWTLTEEEGTKIVYYQIIDNACLLSDIYSDSIVLDKTPPESFAIKVEPSVRTNNPQPTISFSTKDTLSGMDRYEARINDGKFFVQNSPYTLPKLKDGKHVITVRAYDKAGNYRDVELTIYVDTVAPMIVEIFPERNTPDVSITTEIKVIFSEHINESTLMFTLKDSKSNVVACELKYYDENYTAIFKPHEDLELGKTFTATVNVQDLVGNDLIKEYSWIFTTESPPEKGIPIWLWGIAGGAVAVIIIVGLLFVTLRKKKTPRQ
jgi:hypothetical protein